MSSWSNASPVPIRCGTEATIFVFSEPDKIIAIDARDGRIRWTPSVGDVATSEGVETHEFCILSRRRRPRADRHMIWPPALPAFNLAGFVMHECALDLGSGSNSAYASVTLAGSRLFVSASNGSAVVLEFGRTYRELARNKVEELRIMPVFDGDRMYLRAAEYLYSIGGD